MSKSYCQLRLDQIGISQEENIAYTSPTGAPVLHFDSDSDDNLIIRYCEAFYERPYICTPPGSRQNEHYKRKRLKSPLGDNKYFPLYKGISTRPYLNGVLQYFTKKGKTIGKTLFVTEGEIKAFVCSKNGLPAVGISGIHNFGHSIKDSLGNKIGYKLLPELEEFIIKSGIENIVLVHDSDAIDNAEKQQRAISFYSSVKNFIESVKELNLNTYYCLVRKNQKQAKGIDDLVLLFKDELEPIKEELNSFRSGRFFQYYDLNNTPEGDLLNLFQVKYGTEYDKALCKLLSLGIKRNSITQYFELDGKKLSEQDINTLFIDINSEVKIQRSKFDFLINSNKIPSYNPLHEFFSSNSHLNPLGVIEKLSESLLSNMGFTADQFYPEFKITFIRKWLVGLVASCYENHYNVLMLVLIGAPNCGKTEFFRRLFLGTGLESLFAESKFEEGKDTQALMTEKLLVLNDELASLNKYEAKTFRNFISADSYTYRPPYGKQNVTRKRLASLCGTSNDKAIINDPENNRRIVPIEIRKVDTELYNSIDKTELLIQAYHLYRSGFNWNLTKEEIQMLSECAEDYSISSPEKELISKFFRVPSDEDTTNLQELTASDISLVIYSKTNIKVSGVMLGKYLNQLGFEKKSKKIPKSRNSIQVYSVIEKISDHVLVQKYYQ